MDEGIKKSTTSESEEENKKPIEEIAKEYAQKFGPGHKGRPPKSLGTQITEYNRNKRLLIRKSKDEKRYIIQKTKLDMFLEEYMNNGGNATQAAMKVFNIVKRGTANSVGHMYLKRAKEVGRLIMDDMGIGHKKLIGIALQHAEEGKDIGYWDRLYKIGDYGNFLKDQGRNPSIGIIINNQRKVLSGYIEGEESEEGEVVE